MTIYRFISSSIATSDGIMTLDFPVDGKISGIIFSGRWTSSAGIAVSGLMELSWATGNAFTQNDTRSQLTTLAYASIATTAIVNHGALNIMQDLPMIPYSAGERLYLHHLSVLAPTAASWTLYVMGDDKGTSTRRVRN